MEQLFNDDTYYPKVSFSGLLEMADSSKPPAIYRYDPTLGNHFSEMAPQFTRVYKNWSGTGCSDPANVVEYWQNTNGELTSSSKLLLICFACRPDTSTPEEEFVELITKMHNSRKRGLDIGLGGDLDSDVLDSLSIPSTHGKHRKSEGGEVERKTSETLKRVCFALEKALAKPEGLDRRMQKIQKRSGLLEMLLKAQETVDKAK